MRNLVLVAAGGAVGSAARHLVGLALASLSAAFPWSTLLINVAGALALGVLIGATPPTATARLLVGVGLCGGFTTFSAFAVELVALADRGTPGRAMLYAVASVGLGAAAAVLGIWMGRR